MDISGGEGGGVNSGLKEAVAAGGQDLIILSKADCRLKKSVYKNENSIIQRWVYSVKRKPDNCLIYCL
jgi:hypothetical protein